MTREEIQGNIEQNQYVDPHFTGMRNFVNIMVAQPLLDSYVKSSYAKKTGLAFYHGYKTGIVNNFTFMGGHNLFGSGFFSPLTNRFTKHIRTGGFGTKGGWRFQFVNSDRNLKKAKFFTKENLKPYHADSVNDLIEGGFGFGKDARVLQSLNRSGFKITPEEILNMSNDALEQKIIKHLQGLGFDDLGTIAKKTGTNFNINTVKSMYRRQHSNLVRETNRAFKQKIAKEIFGENFKNKNVAQITEAIQAGKGELFEKIIDSKVVQNFYTKRYNHAFSSVHKEAAEEIGKKIVKEYVRTSAIEKFFASTPVRIITGNFLHGAIGNAVTIGLTAVSMLSNFHQQAALSDFKNTSMYNYRERHFVDSNNYTNESLNSHLMISQSNRNDYYNLLSDQNVSKSYLKDMDPVESRFKYSKVENFTIF